MSTPKRRITIQVFDGVTDELAIARVADVIRGGRISVSAHGACYCYASRFADNVVVVAHRTRAGGDGFHIYRDAVK